MKVLQLNSWSCNLAPAISELLNREQPDIVSLQEVISTDKTGKILQSLEEILEKSPYEYVYYAPLVEFKFMHGTAQRGNAILSKYPFEFTETFWTKGEFQEDFDYSIGYNAARGVACATIQTPAGNVNVLSVHGYHVKEHKNGNEETLAACKMIADYGDNVEGPVIIAGDFNLVPESESMKVFDDNYVNLCTKNNVLTTRNHLTTKSETCDYILTKDLSVDSFSVLEDEVSDHKALIANVSLLI